MGSEAVAAMSSSAPHAAARGDSKRPVDNQITALRSQLGYGRRLRPSRGHLVLLIMVVVGIWVVLSFAGTITQINSANDRQQTLSAETQALNAQLDAGHRELDLVQTEGFQALQARAYGIGAPGETAFSLSSDAPSPAPVVPLGSAASATTRHTPLDAWLRLLFGD